jgi:hypothetical protein
MRLSKYLITRRVNKDHSEPQDDRKVGAMPYLV